ncbi:MAG: FkbM family methyltransferase [Candidatus ainarchaeum sp.]|nr:FkbM family methyltransferase [Candidatus ainarchaeum sp.]
MSLNIVKNPATPYLMVGCHPNCRSCTLAPLEVQSIQFLLHKFKNRFNLIGLDLGAHVGLYGVALHKHFKLMYSYEIWDVPYKTLCEQARIYHEIIPIKLGVWSKKGTVNIVMGDLDTQGAIRYKDRTTEKTYPVEVVCLDEELGPDFKFDFVKIDVEGAEFEVLTGMKGLIKNNSFIGLVEYSLPALDCLAHNKYDFLGLLDNLNFEILWPNREVLDNPPGNINIIFEKK